LFYYSKLKIKGVLKRFDIIKNIPLGVVNLAIHVVLFCFLFRETLYKRKLFFDYLRRSSSRRFLDTTRELSRANCSFENQ